MNRRILRFSIWMGTFGVISTAGIYFASFYPALRSSQRINLRTLSEIHCQGLTCDSGAFTTDQEEGSDYVIDAQTKYVLSAPPSSVEYPLAFRSLDFVDVSFIRKFREPKSYQTPDYEVWRLYSQDVTVGDKTLEIIVGLVQKAPLKLIETPSTLLHDVDVGLEAQIKRIGDNFSRNGIVGGPARLSVDGYEIVEADTGEVLARGSWLPTFVPDGTRFPSSGVRFYVNNKKLYMIQTDTDGRLFAISLIPIGSLLSLFILAAFAFFVASAIARWLSRRFLRNYFAFYSARVPDIDEALRCGEGQNIEFKRGLPAGEARSSGADAELLKSIAAFANTNYGAIFVGVDDRGTIKGLQLDFKMRDSFEERIRTLVRNNIRPTPPIQITFADIRGSLIARIAVARDAAPIHMLHGVIYIRYGSSDVQAQPEDLAKLVAEYAA